MDVMARKSVGRGPHPGDVCLCAYCGQLNCIMENMKLRKASPQEEERTMQNPEMAQIVRAVRQRVFRAKQ